MGNRAVIMFEDSINTTDKYVGVYVHWNGGPESVYAYLDYLKSVHGLNSDYAYTRARFIQVVGNFFGGTMSLGVDLYSLEDACNTGSDNGVYVVSCKNTGDYVVDRYNWNGIKFTNEEVKAEKDKALASPYWTRPDNIVSSIKDMNKTHFVTK